MAGRVVANSMCAASTCFAPRAGSAPALLRSAGARLLRTAAGGTGAAGPNTLTLKQRSIPRIFHHMWLAEGDG